jgi:hypothetical protein
VSERDVTFLAEAAAEGEQSFDNRHARAGITSPMTASLGNGIQFQAQSSTMPNVGGVTL